MERPTGPVMSEEKRVSARKTPANKAPIPNSSRWLRGISGILTLAG